VHKERSGAIADVIKNPWGRATQLEGGAIINVKFVFDNERNLVAIYITDNGKGMSHDFIVDTWGELLASSNEGTGVFGLGSKAGLLNLGKRAYFITQTFVNGARQVNIVALPVDQEEYTDFGFSLATFDPNMYSPPPFDGLEEEEITRIVAAFDGNSGTTIIIKDCEPGFELAGDNRTVIDTTARSVPMGSNERVSVVSYLRDGAIPPAAVAAFREMGVLNDMLHPGDPGFHLSVTSKFGNHQPSVQVVSWDDDGVQRAAMMNRQVFKCQMMVGDQRAYCVWTDTRPTVGQGVASQRGASAGVSLCDMTGTNFTREAYKGVEVVTADVTATTEMCTTFACSTLPAAVNTTPAGVAAFIGEREIPDAIFKPYLQMPVNGTSRLVRSMLAMATNHNGVRMYVVSANVRPSMDKISIEMTPNCIALLKAVHEVTLRWLADNNWGSALTLQMKMKEHIPEHFDSIMRPYFRKAVNGEYPNMWGGAFFADVSTWMQQQQQQDAERRRQENERAEEERRQKQARLGQERSAARASRALREHEAVVQLGPRQRNPAPAPLYPSADPTRSGRRPRMSTPDTKDEPPAQRQRTAGQGGQHLSAGAGPSAAAATARPVRGASAPGAAAGTQNGQQLERQMAELRELNLDLTNQLRGLRLENAELRNTIQRNEARDAASAGLRAENDRLRLLCNQHAADLEAANIRISVITNRQRD
jgi:Histidine kinase-, DNA gyrase B-, and HSP90-like ATPase